MGSLLTRAIIDVFLLIFAIFKSIHLHNSNDETNIVPTSERLKQPDEFDLAQDAIFHAVEKTEKAVVGALEKEVDLIFRHQGDVQRQEKKRAMTTATTAANTAAGKEVKSAGNPLTYWKKNKKEDCLNKVEQKNKPNNGMKERIRELLVGQIE